MKKRIFSVLVILALLVTAAVFTVQAEEATCPCCGEKLSDISWTTWTSTGSTGFNTSDHYKLPTGGVTLGSQVKFTGGTIVLDLAGEAMTTGSTNARAIYVNAGTVHIIDSVGGGSVSGLNTNNGCTAFVNTNGTLNIYGGTITSTATATGTDRDTIRVNAGKVNIYGGTVEGNAKAGAIYQLLAASRVTVDGGTVNGGSRAEGGAAYVSNGKLTVKSGTVNASTAATKGSAIYVATNGALEVTGTGVVDGSNVTKGSGTVGTVYSDGTVTVSGGEIKGASVGSGGSIFVNAGSLTVSGGKVSGGQAANYGDDIYVTNADAEVTFSGGEVSGQVQINTAKTVTVSGAPKLGELKLPESVDLTLGELTTGADICIAALDGAFTLENENASSYVGYFHSNNADKEIVCTDNVLYVQDKAPVVTEWECPHCGETVTWTALDGAPVSGTHYYLTEERTANISVAAGDEIILDLRGQNFTVANNRAFMVRGTLHLTDSLNTGIISSGNGTTAYNGGVFSVQSGAAVYMYGGKAVSAATTTAAKGSVAYVVSGGAFYLKGGELDANGKGVTPVYVNGTFTMTDGRITGNEAALGGSVYVSKTGDFTLVGGTVAGGSSTGAEGVYAEGGDNIYVDGGVFTMSGGTVTVEDTENRANAVLGVNNAKISLTGLAADAAVSGHVEADDTSNLTADCGAGVFDAMGRQAWYANTDEAMAKYKSLIRFYTDGALTLTKKACVDVNGHKVTVTADESLTEAVNMAGMDSTATLTAPGTGEATVGAGINVPLSFTYDGNRYVSVVDNGKATYHVISLAISKVFLRPSSTGIYYSTGIYCDEILEKEIATYGVAVSLVDVPTSAFADPASKCLYTETVTDGNFESGEYTGALVNNILVAGVANNADRAEMPVYANAYVTFANGETMVNSVSAAPRYSLKDLVQTINRLYPTLDGNTKQTDGLKAMYNKFADVMNTWELNNIQADAEGTYGTVKHLKVLTLGHSLAVDAGHMLAKVAAAEGATDITVGTLHYSGCTLTQHVNHLSGDIAAYDLYYSNLMNADAAPTVIKGVTMEYGLQADNWDVIIMQAGVFEAGLPSNLEPAGSAAAFDTNLQTLMDYVKTYRPSAKFVWNMTWACPGADSGLLNESYTNSFSKYFDSDQMAMYEAICDVVKTKIATNENFTAIIPTGTAMQNANETMTDVELYRDSIHATDLARVMASYIWYSVLTGRELTGIKLNTVPAALCNTYTDGDMTLTQTEKDLILNCVTNAIKTPYAVSAAN